MRLKDLLGIDYFLLFAALILSFFGILFIYSSGVNASGELVSNEYIRQAIWAACGFVLILVLAIVNYRRFYEMAPYLYIGIIILLLYTCFFGRYVNGARRALGVGVLSVQPAEFSKIITVFMLARFLDSTKRERNGFYRFIVSSLIVLVPMGIVLLQPDLGTALVFIPVFLAMTFVAGLSLRYVLFMVLLVTSSVLLTLLPYWEQYILKNPRPVLSILSNLRFTGVSSIILMVIFGIAVTGYKLYKKSYFYWISYFLFIAILSIYVSFAAHKVLKEYQVMRLIVFMDPGVDPRGAGWNIIQSMIAIGSGNISGKGFLQGTQSHYRFLPEQSTDFIFSIYGEEFGFVGGIFIFSMFLLISMRMIRIMKLTADSFGLYIIAGLSAMYVFHFLINVGMTMGIMPITGIPLYFMSYGGSALVSAMAGIGICMSVFIRRFRR